MNALRIKVETHLLELNHECPKAFLGEQVLLVESHLPPVHMFKVLTSGSSEYDLIWR